MSKLVISENIISRALRSVINEMILRENGMEEDTVANVDGTTTVDNFDLFADLLDSSGPDDVWFVKIVMRKKDNPNQKKNDIYLSNYYLFHNSNEMYAKEQEIKDLCNKNNARAYFYANKRSESTINDYAKQLDKKWQQRGKGYSKYRGHAVEFAAGQSKDRNETDPLFSGRTRCFIDIDNTDVQKYNTLMDLCKQYNIKPNKVYRSANFGWHIQFDDWHEAEKLKQDLQKIDDGYPLGRYATAGFEYDKPLLLYCRLIPHSYDKQFRMQDKLKGIFDRYQTETDPRKKKELYDYYRKMTGVDLNTAKKI